MYERHHEIHICQRLNTQSLNENYEDIYVYQNPSFLLYL